MRIPGTSAIGSTSTDSICNSRAAIVASCQVRCGAVIVRTSSCCSGPRGRCMRPPTPPLWRQNASSYAGPSRTRSRCWRSATARRCLPTPSVAACRRRQSQRLGSSASTQPTLRSCHPARGSLFMLMCCGHLQGRPRLPAMAAARRRTFYRGCSRCSSTQRCGRRCWPRGAVRCPNCYIAAGAPDVASSRRQLRVLIMPATQRTSWSMLFWFAAGSTSPTCRRPVSTADARPRSPL